MKHVFVLLAATVLLLETGCVTGRRSIALPIQPVAAVPPTKGDIRISEVVDNRQFENKPSQPSTPSIDGDVNTLSSEQKNVMIGRQRNTYGKAMGDVSLAPGDSVNKRVRALMEQGLQQRGYRVISDDTAA